MHTPLQPRKYHAVATQDYLAGSYGFGSESRTIALDVMRAQQRTAAARHNGLAANIGNADDTAWLVHGEFQAATALAGAIDGAMSVLGTRLATAVMQRTVGVTADAARAALVHRVVQAGTSAAPRLAQARVVALAAVESAIDGAVGAMASDLLLGVIDEATWKKGVLDGLGRVAVAAVRAGLLGAAT